MAKKRVTKKASNATSRREDSSVSVAVRKGGNNLLVEDAANAIQANINRMPLDQKREVNRAWQQVAVSLGLKSTVATEGRASLVGVSVWTER